MWMRYEDKEGNWHTACAGDMDALERFVYTETGQTPECIQEADEVKLEVCIQAVAEAPHYPLMDLADILEQALSQVSMAANRHECGMAPVILPIRRTIEADESKAALVIRQA